MLAFMCSTVLVLMESAAEVLSDRLVILLLSLCSCYKIYILQSNIVFRPYSIQGMIYFEKIHICINDMRFSALHNYINFKANLFLNLVDRQAQLPHYNGTLNNSIVVRSSRAPITIFVYSCFYFSTQIWDRS